MSLIDRHILGRFLMNFALLFMLLFVFAVSIDLVLSLDKFVEAARNMAGEDAGTLAVSAEFIRLALNFQTPRFFQFYAYLHGLVAVGAMAFTLAQMHRHRELVAVLAAGVSLHRAAMPFVVGVFGLSVIQLLNQEFMLPKVAPLLIRDHGDIGRQSVEEFPIRFTADGKGALFQAPSFEPRMETLTGLTILERDDLGRTKRRITAERAKWHTRQIDGVGVGGWHLDEGRVVALAEEARITQDQPVLRTSLDFYATDLTPRVLIVRRYGEFAAMLSLHQIDEMLDTLSTLEEGEVESLRRYQFTRFASVLVNVLVMWMTLPTFLLRQPANLLTRTLYCAGIAIPAMFGAAVFMMADLPGISPEAGVFLPVVIFVPIVMAQWTYIKT